MSADIYDQAYVSLDGLLLGEATTISTSLEGDDQDVVTLVKGFAGQTPSPRKRVTSIENHVLTTGFEYPFEKKQRDSVVVTMGVQLGGSGKKLATKGFLRNVKVEAGVGKSLMVSFEHHGEPAIFE